MTVGASARFLDPATLGRISSLDLIAKTVVEGFISGLHRSPFLGRTMDFAEYRAYNPGDDIQRMFELPRYVLRRGQIVVEDGEVRSSANGTLFRVAPGYDAEAVPDIRDWFEKYYTIGFRNYPVDEHYLGENCVVATRS